MDAIGRVEIFLQLAQAQANLGKTQLDVDRDTPLAKERAIAQSQLDNDVQANLAAKAAAKAAEALMSLLLGRVTSIQPEL